MHRGGHPIQIGVPSTRRASRLAPIALLVLVAAGCSSPANHPPPATQSKVTPCGAAKTAADVPVHVEIAKGHVSCGTAQAIERKYAAAIRSGLAPGNGGGGPVKVNGWTCQGFTTPVVLHTGKASRCVQGSNEILEILSTTT